MQNYEIIEQNKSSLVKKNIRGKSAVVKIVGIKSDFFDNSKRNSFKQHIEKHYSKLIKELLNN